MAKEKLSVKINGLFQRCEWEKARKLLQEAREKDPTDHWLLTQLGVTLYEEGKYQEALPLFQESWKIVKDCPLTLWNLAGTLDALGKHANAMRIYTWLLKVKKSPQDDPCWESAKWTDALKADCAYRIGLCFQHLGQMQKAEHCYRQYINLLLSGINGSYAIEDVMGQIRGLPGAKNGKVQTRSEKVFHSVLQTSGILPRRKKGGKLPELRVGELV
jgi:tetratricopeptide (TPR) repeat protein